MLELLTLNMQRPLETLRSVHELDLRTVYWFDIPVCFQLINFRILCKLHSCLAGDKVPHLLYDITHSSSIKSAVS